MIDTPELDALEARLSASEAESGILKLANWAIVNGRDLIAAAREAVAMRELLECAVDDYDAENGATDSEFHWAFQARKALAQSGLSVPVLPE